MIHARCPNCSCEFDVDAKPKVILMPESSLVVKDEPAFGTHVREAISILKELWDDIRPKRR